MSMDIRLKRVDRIYQPGVRVLPLYSLIFVCLHNAAQHTLEGMVRCDANASLQDTVEGFVVVNSKGKMSHNGIKLYVCLVVVPRNAHAFRTRMHFSHSCTPVHSFCVFLINFFVVCAHTRAYSRTPTFGDTWTFSVHTLLHTFVHTVSHSHTHALISPTRILYARSHSHLRTPTCTHSRTQGDGGQCWSATECEECGSL